MTINQRLTKVRKTLFNTRKEFAFAIGKSDRTVENWDKMQSGPAVKDLSAIAKLDDRINFHWVITGEGSMLLEDKGTILEYEIIEGEQDLYNIKVMKITVEGLIKRVTNLERKLENKDAST